MAHFALVQNGLVTDVVVADQDFINTGALGDPANWVQTSYNTYGNVHYAPSPPAEPMTPDGGVALRGNYAGIGYTYDIPNDVFYAPQPYPSWTLNKSTWKWEAPVALPADSKSYNWNETTQSWEEVILSQ